MFYFIKDKLFEMFVEIEITYLTDFLISQVKYILKCQFFMLIRYFSQRIEHVCVDVQYSDFWQNILIQFFLECLDDSLKINIVYQRLHNAALIGLPVSWGSTLHVLSQNI